MEGYQFAHMEVYSAKGAPGADAGTTAKRKNGQRAWTAQEILDEAERLELASLHVADGGPPPEIIPGDVDTFDALRDAHVIATSKKQSFQYTKKDGSVGMRHRKLRADAASLYTCVVSLPVLTEDALADPALKSDCMRVIEQAMQHERKRVESLGGRMMMGVVHLDEKHVHVHLYALDPLKRRVDHLHPGRAAKTAFYEAHKGKPSKDVKKAANGAYCDAMRAWQSDLHENVFADAGLLRFGPGRARLSTAEYHKQKAAKAQEAKDRDRAEAAKARRETYEAALAGAIRQAGQAVQESAKASTEAAKKKVDLLVWESDVAAREAEAREEVRRGREIAHSAEAQMRAIKVGMDAIETRQLDYRPAKPKKPEGLNYGPAAPKDPAKRTTLTEAIRPAYDFLVKIAKKAFGIREKDEELRQKTLAHEAEIEAQEAEMRRRATVVASAERKAGRSVDAEVNAVSTDHIHAKTHACFPTLGQSRRTRTRRHFQNGSTKPRILIFTARIEPTVTRFCSVKTTPPYLVITRGVCTQLRQSLACEDSISKLASTTRRKRRIRHLPRNTSTSCRNRPKSFGRTVRRCRLGDTRQ